MAVTIIIRGKRKSWHRQKDVLHTRRRVLAGKMQDGIMSKNEMNRGSEGEPEFDARVEKYDKWKGKNQSNMNEFHDINKEFKKHGEEGRPHSIDDIRPGGKMITD